MPVRALRREKVASQERHCCIVRILLMPVRALRPTYHHEDVALSLRQNPINARKGITTNAFGYGWDE